MYVKINGAYVDIESAYVKKNGAYKQALVYIKNEGTYIEGLSGAKAPKYSLNPIDIMIQKGQILVIPITIYDASDENTFLWQLRIDSGSLSIQDENSKTVNLITDDVSSTGALWCEIDGVSLGEIPVNIEYSGGF